MPLPYPPPSSPLRSSIPNIPWNAAFHGVIGDHSSRWLPALLVSLNLFAADVVAAAALPLLALWPYARGRIAFAFAQRHAAPAVEQKCEAALQVGAGVVNSWLEQLLGWGDKPYNTEKKADSAQWFGL